MKKFLSKFVLPALFTLTIVIQHEYVIDNNLFLDFTVNDTQYKQLTMPEFQECVSIAIEKDVNSKLK